MTARFRLIPEHAVWALSMALTVAGAVLIAISWSAPVPDAWGVRGFGGIFTVLFGTVGLFIVRRLPRHPVGRLLLAAALVSAVQLFAIEYGTLSYYSLEEPLPAASWLAWLNVWVWVGIVAIIAIGVPLYFPNGRLPSPRWRAAVWASVVATIVTAVTAATDPLQLGVNMRGVPPPYDAAGLESIGGLAQVLFNTVGFGLFGFLALAAAGSLFLRFRSATGVERQQIKWLAYAAVAVALAAVLNVVVNAARTEANNYGSAFKPAEYALIAAMGLVPIAIGIAVLRYRLYDIDVVINRTIVYAVVSTLLAGTYLAAVVLFQAVLRPLTTGSEVAVAASTLLVVGLFQPIRARVQAAVDRRFYRARYDASRTVDRFSTRLREQVDLDQLRGELIGVVDDTIKPSHASLWLRR